MQRYSQSSVLKRTALELIAEDMLSRATQDNVEASVVEEEADEDDWEDRIEDLLHSAHFGTSDHISRHQLSCVLQSLGTPLEEALGLWLSNLVQSIVLSEGAFIIFCFQST